MENIIAQWLLQSKQIFFLNGLCLLLKNPEGIRSMLEGCFFFSLSKSISMAAEQFGNS